MDGIGGSSQPAPAARSVLSARMARDMNMLDVVDEELSEAEQHECSNAMDSACPSGLVRSFTFTSAIWPWRRTCAGRQPGVVHIVRVGVRVCVQCGVAVQRAPVALPLAA